MIKDVDKFDREAEYDQMRTALELVGFHEDVPLEYNNLSELIGARQSILEKFLKPEQVGKLKLIPKIAAEMMKNEAKKGRRAVNPHDAVVIISEYVALEKYGQEYEALYGMYLDPKNRVIDIKRVGEGTVDQVPLYTREIIREGLRCGASSLLVAHNLTGGSTDMSAQDISMNETLRKACDTMGIKLIDFIVVAGNKYLSVADNFQEKRISEKRNAEPEIVRRAGDERVLQPALLEKRGRFRGR